MVLAGLRGGLGLSQALALALVSPERWEEVLEGDPELGARARQAEAQWALEALAVIMRGERGAAALVQVLRGRGLLGVGAKAKSEGEGGGLAALGTAVLQVALGGN